MKERQFTETDVHRQTTNNTPVPILSPFGSFSVRGVGCYNNAHIVATHPAFTNPPPALIDANLSDWSCSVHEAFDNWPRDTFLVLAIAKDIGSSYTAPDGTVGTPYILARGKGLTVISDIRLTPENATNIVNAAHTVVATVATSTNGVTRLVGGATVTFRVVSGPNIGATSTGVTDTNGVTSFTYVGSGGVGVDFIEATFVDSRDLTQTSNRARKEWVPNNNCSRTYTLDTDFDLGTLFNLNHTNVSDQLQINAGTLSTFPIMWIANAGEDSVSKIDTTTGRELARYRTWFGPAGQPGYFNHLGNEYSGAAPSRTAVDREGNCYVANRHFDNRPADVLKILATGGNDRNGNGTIETSIDSNNNGIADPAEILPMGDANGNGQIDPNEIGDERIAWAVSVGPAGALGRSLAIDGDGNIWLGLYNTQVYYKLSSVDGSILAGPIDVSPNTPYGALVDGDGILWGASLDGTLLKLDTRTNTKLNVYNHGFGTDYGIAIGNNRVYQANLDGNTYTEFNPVTESFSAPAASRFTAYGIAVDGNGDIFVANGGSGGVTKFHPDGTVIWSMPAQATTGEARGCVVDSNNDVWLIHRTSANISKYRGTDGTPLGVFPVGDGPYTYTDATGIGRFNSTAPSGTWTVVQDSGAPGTIWGTVSWNGSTPPGTAIKVEARAADTQVGLGSRNFKEVTNSTSFCDQGIAGQFIQVRTTLARPLAETNSPVLYDLTVAGCAGCVTTTNCPLLIHASGVETNTLRVRQTGLFYQTVDVTNTCDSAISGCRLYLEGLSTNVSVHNASGVSNGVPYLEYHLPIPPHQGIEFVVEYYVPDRRTLPNPTFRGEAVVASAPPAPDGTLGSILRFLTYTNCAFLVEFSTLSNRTYYVQYTSDLTTNAMWKTAVPAVVGNGSSVQWLDSGPPKTESLPCTQTNRYYRVVLVP